MPPCNQDGNSTGERYPGMRRKADRRDQNEKDIISYLERCGCRVQQLSQRGVPDLLVGAGDFNLLMEVKMPGGKLTPDQQGFFKKWGNTQVAVVTSRSDAKKVIREYMPVRIYECETCGRYERRESFKTAPLTACVACGKVVKQVYTAPFVIYRGNGWAGKNGIQGQSGTDAGRAE